MPRFDLWAENREKITDPYPHNPGGSSQWPETKLKELLSRAIEEYEAGTSYLFTRREVQENADYLNGFRTEDPIEAVLDDYLVFQTEIQAYQAVEHCLQIPRHLQERKHTRRITNMLKARGWFDKTTSRKEPGKTSSASVRVWRRSEHSIPQVASNLQGDF